MLIRSSHTAISFSCSMYSEAPEITASGSTSMCTAQVKAIALPALQCSVYRVTNPLACLLSCEVEFYVLRMHTISV